MPRRVVIVIGIVAVVVWSPPSRADRIEFARGGRVDGPIRAEGQTVVYDGPTGTVTFHRDELLAIEDGHWPPSEWPERWAAAREADTSARFAAAWWALENGLTNECAAALRTIRESDPEHQPTARMVAVLDALARPCPDPDLRDVEPLKRGLNREDRSDHVLLLHAQAPNEAEARLDLLERVLTAFYLNLAAHGVRLEPPERRAVVLWVPDRMGYREALALSGSRDFANTRGYFHPSLQVVLTYDGRSEPDYREKRRVIERQRSEALEHTRRDLNRRLLLLDLERLDIEYGAAAHELIHLLVRVSGLVPSHEDFPVWLHEGLAMQFEVVRSGRWAGVSRVNPHRLAYWPEPPSAPRLAWVLADRGFRGAYRADAYAAAWGLVYYLIKTRPDEFVDLLERLRHPGMGKPTVSSRFENAFATIFADRPGNLEPRWHAYIQQLAEEHPEIRTRQ